MSGSEKSRAQAEQAKGKVKATVGHVVGSQRMTAEGHAEQAKGKARQAKEDTKDAFRR
ncbi:CsbD family protein [Streptomyces sp. 3211]|uniref:CsbD family protein n=1 Tax=Streptomyces sp. 3211 TaxID=1964449 RepID=UPI0009A4E60C|nr:CsbD family protein [Streptomyces sp. 3211]